MRIRNLSDALHLSLLSILLTSCATFTTKRISIPEACYVALSGMTCYNNATGFGEYDLNSKKVRESVCIDHEVYEILFKTN